VAVAESCTSGMVGARLTRIPGSSNYFSGGVLCYSNKVKTDLCRVPEETLARHGAVSGETAEALARGVRLVLGSAIGLSVTGIAGPGGGSAEKPLGLIFVGLSDDNRTLHIRRILPGNRDAVRERAAFFALACLRRFLMPENSVP
jgi:nicotinamide-nucleotide amidase